MKKKIHASLQPSEMAIFRAAANIFAGYVATGKVTEENEKNMIKKSIETSVKIANLVDQSIQRDDELG